MNAPEFGKAKREEERCTKNRRSGTYLRKEEENRVENKVNV